MLSKFKKSIGFMLIIAIPIMIITSQYLYHSFNPKWLTVCEVPMGYNVYVNPMLFITLAFVSLTMLITGINLMEENKTK